MSSRLHRLLSVSLLALAIAACAGNEPRGKQRDSSLDGMATMPEWIQGVPDDKNPASLDTEGGLQRWFKGKGSEETEERIADLERQLMEAELRREEGPATVAYAAPLPASTQRPYAKLGLLAADGADARLVQQLQLALEGLGASYATVIVPTADLRAQAQGYGCAGVEVQNCLSGLATYPGIHTLAVLTPDKAERNSVAVQVTLHDTAHQVTGTPQQYTLPNVDGRVPEASVRTMATNLLQASVRTARTAPWSTRAFGNEAEQWYLAAGQRSGLKVGDVLEVRSPGRVVRSPTGGIAGHVPGALKGRLRVTAYLGDDNAIAEALEGVAPTQDDRITMPTATDAR